MVIPFLPRGPAEESFAPGADGTRIHYSVWDPLEVAPGGATDAPPPHTLVLCDGIGCDGYAWKYLIRHFQRTCRIIHWQYRGHGKSGLPQACEIQKRLPPELVKAGDDAAEELAKRAAQQQHQAAQPSAPAAPSASAGRP